MAKQLTDELVSDFVDLGGLLMAFAKVNRATYLDTNRTPESDTDHSVMLGVMACALAEALQLNMDLGKVAQYALIHDLVEVYAGDVNTINFHTTDTEAKEREEAKALARIKEQFSHTLPWIHTTIERYETLADKEARYVKTLDKAMPSITHIHTDGLAVDDSFDDPVAFEASVRAKNAHLRNTYAHDLEVIMQLREALLKPTIDRKYEKHGKKATA
jgi:putative hydrolases of HD superfamily